MESYDFAEDKESVRVSGTLDALAMYMEKEYNFTAKDATKVAALLWLEQECEFAETIRIPELHGSLKSLTEFENEDTKAQGMAFNSRIFINLERAKAEAFRAIPLEVVEQLLGIDGLSTKTVRMLLRVIQIALPNIQLVPEGLTCVCMRAWNHVKHQEHVPFRLENVMPELEFPKDQNSQHTCEVTRKDGQQHIGNVIWECLCHRDDNYCTLTTGKAQEMLNVLVQLGVLEKVDNERYAFL